MGQSEASRTQKGGGGERDVNQPQDRDLQSSRKLDWLRWHLPWHTHLTTGTTSIGGGCDVVEAEATNKDLEGQQSGRSIIVSIEICFQSFSLGEMRSRNSVSDAHRKQAVWC
jgi:hypothetical protein